MLLDDAINVFGLDIDNLLWTARTRRRVSFPAHELESIFAQRTMCDVQLFNHVSGNIASGRHVAGRRKKRCDTVKVDCPCFPPYLGDTPASTLSRGAAGSMPHCLPRHRLRRFFDSSLGGHAAPDFYTSTSRLSSNLKRTRFRVTQAYRAFHFDILQEL
jgi:hypothetical protein